MQRLLGFYILVTSWLLGGCSYYGTNTYLVPSDADKILHCSPAEVSVGSIMTAQDKKAYAIAGIPYFPAILPSSPPTQLGHLTISLRNIPSSTKCTTGDLSLTDGVSQTGRFPMDVFQSKPVEGSQGISLSCDYEFGIQVDEDRPYSINFSKNFLGCTFPEVHLTVKADTGYHQELVQ
jgi:hypothetical protein